MFVIIIITTVAKITNYGQKMNNQILKYSQNLMKIPEQHSATVYMTEKVKENFKLSDICLFIT